MLNPEHPEEWIQWLEQAQQRLQCLLDAEIPKKRQQTFDELMELSNGFLELSKTFLDLGKTASDAAQRMLDVPGEHLSHNDHGSR